MPAAPGFAASLPPDHLLVALAASGALATLDVWCRGTRRENKCGTSTCASTTSPAPPPSPCWRKPSPRRRAPRSRPLLASPGHRADLVAVGVRGAIVALYMELN
ncbi:MAG: hypothetical protein U0802_06295 [Candidatus Binatia bacterium]